MCLVKLRQTTCMFDLLWWLLLFCPNKHINQLNNFQGYNRTSTQQGTYQLVGIIVTICIAVTGGIISGTLQAINLMLIFINKLIIIKLISSCCNHSFSLIFCMLSNLFFFGNVFYQKIQLKGVIIRSSSFGGVMPLRNMHIDEPLWLNVESQIIVKPVKVPIIIKAEIAFKRALKNK